jgi:flagellar basal-body rod modification protein FlgD
MVTLPVTPPPVLPETTTGATSTGSSNNNGNLGLGGTQLNTQDFISILTAQLQYQDPLNPVDPNQFVGEMAQFASLNELIGIKQDLDQGLQTTQTPTGTQPASAPTSTTSGQTPAIS